MHDLRLTVRTLRATPVISVVAVLSLALGIGANTAIFSLINSLLLRTLPVADPERLVTVGVGPALSYRPNYSYATFDQIRRHGDLFDGAIAYGNCCGKSTLRIDGETQTVDDQFVSGDFFTTLGVPAAIGRMFTAADDVAGGGPDGPVAVISYRLWQQRFGGAAGVRHGAHRRPRCDLDRRRDAARLLRSGGRPIIRHRAPHQNGAIELSQHCVQR